MTITVRANSRKKSVPLQSNFPLSMKKLFSLLFAVLLTSSVMFAQDTFQGSITYDFKMMGEGVEQMEAFMPTSTEIHVRDMDIMLKMNGGMMEMMMGRIVVMGKKGETYMIKDSEQKAYFMEAEDDQKEMAEKMAPTITKEDEVITIQGYECTKYKVEVENPKGGTITQYIWATDKFKFPKMEGGLSSMGTGGLNIEGLKGTPLKIMSSQMGFTTVMTATNVSTSSPDKDLFKIPKGYKKEKFDPNSLMGGMR